jgi:hypothetical protein
MGIEVPRVCCVDEERSVYFDCSPRNFRLEGLHTQSIMPSVDMFYVLTNSMSLAT